MAYAGYMAGPERRRQILDGARRVFAVRGYHDTNVSHICEGLGIGRGTLYQYFGSKRDVFVAIVEDLCERLRTIIATRPAIELAGGPRPTREQLVHFSAARLRQVLEAVFVDEASLRILLREAIGIDVQLDEVLGAIDAIVIDACAGDLESAQRAGIVRADVDVRLVAMLVVGGVEKLALEELRRPGRGDTPVDLDRLSEQVTRLHLFGVVAPEVGT